MKQKDILIIVILFFISSLVWIGTSIYHSGTNSTISETTNNNIAPIDPTFNTKTIEKLKTRKRVSPSFEQQVVNPIPVLLPNLVIPPQKATEEGKLLL